MSAATVEVGFSLGSNIGDKAGNIRRAAEALEQGGAVSGLRLSSLYRTAPWGHVVDQDWFINACAVGTTTLSPDLLLAACKAIEAALGRTATVRWGPRLIDIDILYYGTLALDSSSLTIPHKEILRRAFVLLPLAEIRPDRLIGAIRVADAAARIDAAGVNRIETEVR